MGDRAKRSALRVSPRVAEPSFLFISLVSLALFLCLPSTNLGETPQAVRLAAAFELPIALPAENRASGAPDAPFGLAKSGVWFVSLVASVLLTAFLKDRWEAPRPILQITDFSFRSAEGENAEALIEPALARQISKHYYLPNLQPPVTIASLHATIDDYKRLRSVYQGAEDGVVRVLTLIQGQSTAIALENRRRILLQMLADDPSDQEVIDRCAQVVAGEMELDHVLDTKYQRQPEGSESLRINLREQTYDLSPLDEETMARDAARTSSDANAYARRKLIVHRANLYRRVMILYEPDVLFELFTRVKTRITAENRAADELIARLSQNDAGQKQRRIAIDVLISNRGQRPIAVRGLGVLRLEVPPAKEGGASTVMIPLTHASAADEMVVVEGGKASTLHQVSSESVEQLIAENRVLLGGDDWTQANALDESRLLLLFKAKTASLTASVALARAGEEPRKARIGPSVPLPVSESAAERTIEEIVKSWT